MRHGGKEGCMKLYMDDVRDAGKEKGGMLDRRDARKEGC